MNATVHVAVSSPRVEVKLHQPIIGVRKSTPTVLARVNGAKIAVSYGGTQVRVRMGGPPGPKGDSASTYTFTQGAPSALWTIAHGLGRFPSVSTVDSAGNSFFGKVQYIDANSLSVSMSYPVSGKAYLN